MQVKVLALLYFDCVSLGIAANELQLSKNAVVCIRDRGIKRLRKAGIELPQLKHRRSHLAGGVKIVPTSQLARMTPDRQVL